MTDLEGSHHFPFQPILIQPKSYPCIHSIPDEIQPGLPFRRLVVGYKCPACNVRLKKSQIKFKKHSNYILRFLDWNTQGCLHM